MPTPLRPHEGLSPDSPDTTPVGVGQPQYPVPDWWFWYRMEQPGSFSDPGIAPPPPPPYDQWSREGQDPWSTGGPGTPGWGLPPDNSRAIVPYRPFRVLAPGVQFRKSRYSRRRYRRYRLRWRS